MSIIYAQSIPCYVLLVYLLVSLRVNRKEEKKSVDCCIVYALLRRKLILRSGSRYRWLLQGIGSLVF